MERLYPSAMLRRYSELLTPLIKLGTGIQWDSWRPAPSICRGVPLHVLHIPIMPVRRRPF